jgi:hypothetical protein
MKRGCRWGFRYNFIREFRYWEGVSFQADDKSLHAGYATQTGHLLIRSSMV